MFNYTVNNLSYLSMYKESKDFLSSNKVDNITVALNFSDNKAYPTHEVLNKIQVGDFVFYDVYIQSITVDEYESGFDNILINLRSKNHEELLKISELFKDNKAILTLDKEDKPFIEFFDYEIAKFKKAYPVLIPIEGSEDEEHYLLHHNFFAGSLFVAKYGVNYVMELITPRTPSQISDMLYNKFNNFNLCADTKENLIEKFYSAFVGEKITDSNKEYINQIDEKITEYEKLIDSYHITIDKLKEQKKKILGE